MVFSIIELSLHPSLIGMGMYLRVMRVNDRFFADHNDVGATAEDPGSQIWTSNYDTESCWPVLLLHGRLETSPIPVFPLSTVPQHSSDELELDI